MENPKLVNPFLAIFILASAAWYGYETLYVAPIEKLPDPSLEVIAEGLIATPPPEPSEAPLPPFPPYIEVADGCGPYFEGSCINMRTGPGEEYPIFARLRSGIVLRVGEEVETGGRGWYKITRDEWLRYPERAQDDWYVAADYVEPVYDTGGEEALGEGSAPISSKRIEVVRSEQMLYAYEGEELFMTEKISTGLSFTPTPRGTFTIYKKTPSRYMQGPIAGISEKIYDLPGVPWNLYFTAEGAVIHGAYWHDRFGEPWSSGCVNLPPEKAKELYSWAELGTKVLIRD